jgi:PKD repeat protein
MKSIALFIALLLTTFADSASAQCQASFTPNLQGNNVLFSNTSTGSYQQVYWDFGDGSSSTLSSPWHQYAQPGVYMVCLTIGDSSTACFDISCATVTIQGSGNCDATFTWVDSSGFTWFYPTTFQSNLSYYWNFGDGNSSTQAYPIHQYNPQGTYVAFLTVIDSANNCFDTYCDTVSNIPVPACAAGFSYQVSNGTAYFNGYNSGTAAVSSYSWIFGDGTTGTGKTPQHTYANPGIYNVCLIISTFSGCVDTVCNTIQIPVSSNCNAVISFSASGLTGYFSGIVTGGIATSYAWYFSDGTTASGQNVTHTFPTSGNYTACLFITTSNNCSDSTCIQVFIPGPAGSCQPYFTYNGNVSNLVSFNNQTPGNPTNYYWNFGDGSTSTSWSPTHNYAQSGVYIVCLTVVDSSVGCSATYCDTITVGNVIGNCDAQFQYFDSLGTYFFAPIYNPNYFYYWNFGDGFVSNATYPTHFYSSSGWYNVCLTVIDSMNNCSDTWCDSIFVPNSNGCQAYFYTLIDTTTGAVTFINQSQGNYTNVIWSFGDGNTSTLAMPTHTYASPGVYIVCLTILGNNCQDSYCDSVVIGSGVNCIPMFYAVPDTLFGNGNVTFYIANNCTGWQYVWTFGDSTSGSGLGPFIHQYSATGWYYVCVTAYDNNGNALTFCDSVYALRLSTGFNEIINTQSLQLYPNPTRGDFQLKFELTKASSIIIEILSIQGQLIQSRVQDNPSGAFEMRFDLSALESGMYMIRIKTAEQLINSRFSIQQ